jgi:hypothetical protein
MKTKRGYKVKVFTSDGEHKEQFNNIEDALYYVDVLIDLGYNKSDITIEDNRDVIIY